MMCCRFVRRAGFKVTREFMKRRLCSSDVQRVLHISVTGSLLVKIYEIPDGLYPGEYLVDVGNEIVDDHGDIFIGSAETDWLPIFRDIATSRMLELIREDLALLGIQHQVFRSEQTLHDHDLITQVVSELEDRDLVYWGVLEPPKGQKPDDWEKREQYLFRSTVFGDDIDRPLKKSDDLDLFCRRYCNT